MVPVLRAGRTVRTGSGTGSVENRLVARGEHQSLGAGSARDEYQSLGTGSAGLIGSQCVAVLGLV